MFYIYKRGNKKYILSPHAILSANSRRKVEEVPFFTENCLLFPNVNAVFKIRVV